MFFRLTISIELTVTHCFDLHLYLPYVLRTYRVLPLTNGECTARPYCLDLNGPHDL